MNRWSFDFQPCRLALPLFVSWLNTERLVAVVIRILCFSITYQRWNDE